jgi:hypothetical protein
MDETAAHPRHIPQEQRGAWTQEDLPHIQANRAQPASVWIIKKFLAEYDVGGSTV